MAQSRATLAVVVAPQAVDDLAAIWRWNAEQYSTSHADRYVDSLKLVIFGLGRSYWRGKPVSSRPDLRYILVRRKRKSHGHVAVYRINGPTVEVLHVFHTAQDWQRKLTS